MNFFEQLFQWIKKLLGKEKKTLPPRAYFELKNPAWNNERLTYVGVLMPTGRSFIHYLDCRRLSQKEAIAIWDKEKAQGKHTSIPTHYIEFFYRTIKNGKITYLVSHHFSFVVPSNIPGQRNHGFNNDEIAKTVMYRVYQQILEVARTGSFVLDKAGKFRLSSYEILSNPALASTYWRNMIEKYFQKLIKQRN